MYLKSAINILFLFFIFLSCSKQSALVDFEYVYIYSSLEDKILIKNIVEKELLGEAYYTPELELKYKPIWKTHEDFLDKPKNSKLMLISLSEPVDTTMDIISKHLFSEFKIQDKMFSVHDYFNRDQVLVFLSYDNINDLNNEIIINKDWIISLFNENEKNAMDKITYRAGINDSLTSLVSRIFDINIDIPMDYKFIKSDNSINNYLWLGRGYPYRWILFIEDDEKYYQNPAMSWNRLEEKFDNILDIEVPKYGASFNTAPMELRGVYGTKFKSDNNTGGPFFSKIIQNYKLGKVLVLSGFVNFPGKSKVFHIKELEHILNKTKYKDGG